MCVGGTYVSGSSAPLFDPVRQEALRLATEWGEDMSPETIVDAAEQFAAYLRGGRVND